MIPNPSKLGVVMAELRRRRIFRTAGYYIVGAWLILQVADVVFPGFGMPDSAIQSLVWAFVVGFPVALQSSLKLSGLDQRRLMIFKTNI
jgi:hypothetical protein